MDKKPLMPTATAVWLIDNTSLTFKQIAEFCGLHALEVEGIANDDVAHGVKGFDPIANGQLTAEQIEKCQSDSAIKLELAVKIHSEPPAKPRLRPRYTPVSRRRDRPDAIAWLVRNHPELTNGQVSKLVGTTKSTISAVRDRTHWNTSSIKPVDPVSLGLCKQTELDDAVQKAARRIERLETEKRRAANRAAKQQAETIEMEIAPEAAPEAALPEDALIETPQAPKPAPEEPTPESLFDLPDANTPDQEGHS